MIRNIVFKVDAEGRVSPAVRQWAGVQNEHNATQVVFDYSVLYEKTENTVDWRIDFDSAEAGFDPGITSYGRSAGISRTIPQKFTRNGGEMSAILVGTQMAPDGSGEVAVVVCSIPVTLFFSEAEHHEQTEGEVAESLSAMEREVLAAEASAKDAAERAKRSEEAADESAELAEEAKLKTEEARFVLEEGATFVFQGGDATSDSEVDLVVDSELSDVSENPVQNKVISKKLKEMAKMDENHEKRLLDAESAIGDNSKNIETVQNDIKGLSSNVRVIESGTSDEWTYRIWSDGTAECWATFGYWNEILNPNWAVRTVAYNRAFPFVFSDVPTVLATLSSVGMWHHFLESVNVSAEEFDSFSFMGYTGQETPVGGNINLYLKGKVELEVG